MALPDAGPDSVTNRHDLRRLAFVAATVAVTLVMVLTGIHVLLVPPGTGVGDTVLATSPTPVGQQVSRTAAGGPMAPLPPSPPSALTIPAIGLATSSLIELGLTAGGAIEIPGSARTIGWLTSTVTPGERGPAVLVGNTELAHQRGVFARLGELRPGDSVVVHRADGVTARFTVSEIGNRPRHGSIARLTAPSGTPVLRLTTCGGHFDASSADRHDDVVVTATLTGTA